MIMVLNVMRAVLILNAKKVPNPRGCNQYKPCSGSGKSAQGKAVKKKATKKTSKKKAVKKKAAKKITSKKSSVRSIKPGGSFETLKYDSDLGMKLPHLQFQGPPSEYKSYNSKLRAELRKNASLRKAVDEYTSGTDINSKLRSSTTSSSIKALDNLTQRNLPSEVVVYRGLGKRGEELSNRFREGKSFSVTDKGFVSTSLDPGVTETFKDFTGRSNVMMELKVKRGAYLEGVTSKPYEEEVLLPRNSKIKITGKEFKMLNGSGWMVLIGEQV